MLTNEIFVPIFLFVMHFLLQEKRYIVRSSSIRRNSSYYRRQTSKTCKSASSELTNTPTDDKN